MDAIPTIVAGAATGKADEAALPPALREYDEGCLLYTSPSPRD